MSNVKLRPHTPRNLTNYDPIPLDEQTLVPSGALKAASRGIPLAVALQALLPDLRSRRHPVKTLRLRVKQSSSIFTLTVASHFL